MPIKKSILIISSAVIIICLALSYNIYHNVFLTLSLYAHELICACFIALFVFLFDKSNRFRKGIASIQISAKAQKIAKLVAIVLIGVLILDEVGLLLNELNISLKLFSYPRAVFANVFVAKGLKYANYALLVVFIREISQENSVIIKKNHLIELLLLLFALNFLFDFLQTIFWYKSMEIIPILLIVALYGYSMLKSMSFTYNLKIGNNAYNVILLIAAMFFLGLTETIITKAILFLYILQPIVRWRRRKKSHSEYQWHIALLFIVIAVHITFIWRLLLSPDPPTESYYQHSVLFSVGIIPVLTYGVHMIKGAYFSFQHYVKLFVLYILSLVVWPVLYFQYISPLNILPEFMSDSEMSLVLSGILLFSFLILIQYNKNNHSYYASPKLFFSKVFLIKSIFFLGIQMIVFYTFYKMIHFVLKEVASMPTSMIYFLQAFILVFIPLVMMLGSRKQYFRYFAEGHALYLGYTKLEKHSQFDNIIQMHSDRLHYFYNIYRFKRYMVLLVFAILSLFVTNIMFID